MLAKKAEVGSDNLGSHGVRILIPSNNYAQATQKKNTVALSLIQFITKYGNMPSLHFVIVFVKMLISNSLSFGLRI